MNSSTWGVRPTRCVLYLDSEQSGGHVKQDSHIFSMVLASKSSLWEGLALQLSFREAHFLMPSSSKSHSLWPHMEQSTETLHYYNYLISVADLSIAPVTLIRLKLFFMIYTTMNMNRERVSSFLLTTLKVRVNPSVKAVVSTSYTSGSYYVCFKDTDSFDFLKIFTSPN